MGPGAQELVHTLTMPNVPVFDPIVVGGVAATATPTQVSVKWTLSNGSSPQFSYKIEVFPDANTAGVAASVVDVIDPDTKECVLPIQGLASPTVKVTITDIFDQISTPIVVAASAAVLTNAVVQPGTVPGLNYKYYEGSWVRLPVFDAALDAASLVQSGAVNYPDISIHRRLNQYACRYEGFVTIPADGIWKFALQSSDGAKLTIDGTVVVDADGLRGGAEKVLGSAGLRAGMHAVALSYFKADSPQQTKLKLRMEGPGVPETDVTTGAWSRTHRR